MTRAFCLNRLLPRDSRDNLFPSFTSAEEGVGTTENQRGIAEVQCIVGQGTFRYPLLIATTKATDGSNALMGSAAYPSVSI